LAFGKEAAASGTNPLALSGRIGEAHRQEWACSKYSRTMVCASTNSRAVAGGAISPLDVHQTQRANGPPRSTFCSACIWHGRICLFLGIQESFNAEADAPSYPGFIHRFANKQCG
jgi:hypothetical protein